MNIFLIILWASVTISSASAQSQKKYEEHEVIEIGNGMKIEVLKSRGEGVNEEYNVIYYTERRQTGRRVWEKTGKIKEMERAANMAAKQGKFEVENAIEDNENMSGITTREAEKINLTEDKIQQAQLQKSKQDVKPKAVMKPKSTSRNNSGNLITSVTQGLASKGFSQSPQTSATEANEKAKNLSKNLLVTKEISTAKLNTPKPVVKNNTVSPDTIKKVQNNLVSNSPKKTSVLKDSNTIRLNTAKPVAKNNTFSIDTIKKVQNNLVRNSDKKSSVQKDTNTIRLNTAKPVVKNNAVSPDTIKKIQNNLVSNSPKKTSVLKDTNTTRLNTAKPVAKNNASPQDTIRGAKTNLAIPTLITKAQKSTTNTSIQRDSSLAKTFSKTPVKKTVPPPDTLRPIQNSTTKINSKNGYSPTNSPNIIKLSDTKLASARDANVKEISKKISTVKDSINTKPVIKNNAIKTLPSLPDSITQPKALMAGTTLKKEPQLNVSLPPAKTSTSTATVDSKVLSAKPVATKDSISAGFITKKSLQNNTSVVRDSVKPVQLAATKIVIKREVPRNSKITNASANYKKFTFDSATAIRIAVFAPLFIDDAFLGSDYNLGKANLPKNILTGLEFYNGVMMAVDSLSLEGVNAEVIIYDTRQTSRSISDILASGELNNIGLVLAYITNTSELKQFSQFALQKNIPLISATYPNTVGITDNPFFVLLNSSFPVHLDGLYKHMQRFYSVDNIIAVRRPGATENFIKTYISDLNKTNLTALKIRWVDLKENFTLADITKNLDSTKNNIVFVASPLESFGLKVVKTLSSNPAYRTTAIGMPTWDGLKELNNRDCGNVEIVYSTPFVYTSQNINLSTGLINKYRDKYYSRPSDMAFKGFETTYHFAKLLSKYQLNLVNNLSDKSFTLFNQFDIQPVKVRKTSLKPDYLENKKLYFIKKQEGNIKSII